MRDVEMTDVMMGVSYLRSRKLADIYYRIHLIEAYGTGIAKIKKSYEGQRRQPLFECAPNSFKAVLYKIERALTATTAGSADREAEIEKIVAERG